MSQTTTRTVRVSAAIFNRADVDCGDCCQAAADQPVESLTMAAHQWLTDRYVLLRSDLVADPGPDFVEPHEPTRAIAGLERALSAATLGPVTAQFDPAYLGQLDEAGLTLTALGSDQTAVHQVRDAAGDVVGLLMPMKAGGMRPVDLTQEVKDAYTRLTEHCLYLSPAGRWRAAAICAGVVPS